MKEPFVSNEKGFLLLEHLIAIVIMGILSLTFLALMQVVSNYKEEQTTLTMHEVNTIAIRLQNEIRSADFLTATQGQLSAHFESENNIVNFFVQNNRLMRQVNGRGGEILVYNISEMSTLLFNEHSVSISLKSLDDNLFQFYLQVVNIAINVPEIVTEAETETEIVSEIEETEKNYDEE